jgi:ribose transport system substrate-binding protein
MRSTNAGLSYAPAKCIIGYKCVEAAVKALKGEQLLKTIDTGFKWYDKTNVDAEEMKPLLYD